MADSGLLDVEFRHVGGRQGPGAGRPSKLYPRAACDIAVSLPMRTYDLAAELLASAVSEMAGNATPVEDAVDRVARNRGATSGRSARDRAGSRPGRAAMVRAVVDVLAKEGYEPRLGDCGIVLVNCPFHRLAADHAELICGINLSLLEGMAAADARGADGGPSATNAGVVPCPSRPRPTLSPQLDEFVVDEGGDAPCWARNVCESCGALVDVGGHACPQVRPVRRSIVGFHQDRLGDWVAELSCLHNQHQRHRPPFQMRPWVLTAEGRQARLGAAIECPLCARAELPEDLTVVRTAGPFDAAGVPAGLLANHVVAEGRWGCIHVADGSVTFSMQTEPTTVVRLGAGDRQPIPPGIPHALTVDGPVRLTIAFMKAPTADT